jgi:hypothetical protein
MKTSFGILEKGQEVIQLSQGLSFPWFDFVVFLQLSLPSGTLLASLSSAHADLHSLRSEQQSSFLEAGTQLNSIIKQSKEAEQRVQALLGQVLGGVNRILMLDTSILTEIFKVCLSLCLVSAFF